MSVTLVAGPPCSGKTTWAREHIAPGDATLDFDDICQELGATRYYPDQDTITRARALWAQRLEGWQGPGRLYVIWTAPRRVDRGGGEGERRKR